MSDLILAIRGSTITFAKKVLFEDLSFNLFTGDRICLIGKNGAGKTTLMNAVFGKIDFDRGERWMAPNCVIGYLTQDEKLPPNLTVIDYIMGELKLDEHKSYLVDIVCDNLQIDKSALTQNLSGGQARRVNLAKALILEPEILLLDEPTNHLDLNIIEWLEEYLSKYRGALLVISHDRKFLEKVSNKVFWLRAGTLKVNDRGYKNFDEWSQNIINHEQRELDNLEKKVELESGWLQTGVTARRKRNIGRLHYLEELRHKLQAQKKLVHANKNQMTLVSDKDFNEDAPQIIASANNVSKCYDYYSSRDTSRAPLCGDPQVTHSTKLLNKFSIKILRGEKIGIVGKNGSGKSTFLKMLIGEETPDSGTIKLARDIEFSYFDQKRSQIKPHATLQEVLCPMGSEYVQLPNGKMRHICSYLKDFLFDPQDTKTLAGTLSGGQQNRLLLAKTLANPGNFLILDEPTNDLDMDSLDMLETYLTEYKGTLLVVSHDRDFLDNVASSILAFEGNGVVSYHLGGYSDYLEKHVHTQKVEHVHKTGHTQRNNVHITNAANARANVSPNNYKQPTQNNAQEFFPEKTAARKISASKIKADLEKTLQKIEKTESKIAELSDELSNTEDRGSANLAHITMEISKQQKILEELEACWSELEEIRKNS